VGGSRTEIAAIESCVARGTAISEQAAGNCGIVAPGKTAAGAEPQQNAQCEDACPGESWRGSVGAPPGREFAVRSAEQKSSNPGRAATDAYAASGASICAAKAIRTIPARKRYLMATHCTASRARQCKRALQQNQSRLRVSAGIGRVCRASMVHDTASS
jgi:hypothetical protein